MQPPKRSQENLPAFHEIRVSTHGNRRSPESGFWPQIAGGLLPGRAGPAVHVPVGIVSAAKGLQDAQRHQGAFEAWRKNCGFLESGSIYWILQWKLVIGAKWSEWRGW